MSRLQRARSGAIDFAASGWSEDFAVLRLARGVPASRDGAHFWCAESALSATQAGYEVGTRNIVDVLASQRAVFQSKRNYSNARYDYILSMMSLKEVAGQLSPDDIYQLNAWLDPAIAISK